MSDGVVRAKNVDDALEVLAAFLEHSTLAYAVIEKTGGSSCCIRLESRSASRLDVDDFDSPRKKPARAPAVQPARARTTEIKTALGSGGAPRAP